MAESANILTKLQDLLVYLIAQLNKFPRDQKFMLGDRIATISLKQLVGNDGSAGQSVGENGGKEGVSSSTAERRELRLANRRSARFSSLADA